RWTDFTHAAAARTRVDGDVCELPLITTTKRGRPQPAHLPWPCVRAPEDAPESRYASGSVRPHRPTAEPNRNGTVARRRGQLASRARDDSRQAFDALVRVLAQS